MASALWGLHEPRPWPRKSAKAYHGDPEAIADTADVLLQRLQFRAPAIVDLHHSWCVPLIMDIDPDASFAWAVRHPADYVASALGGNWWKPENEAGDHDNTIWHPAGGWPEGTSRIEKATRYWRAVNEMLMIHYVAAARPWRCHRTTDLPQHLAAATHGNPPLTGPERAAVMAHCGGVWAAVDTELAEPWPP